MTLEEAAIARRDAFARWCQFKEGTQQGENAYNAWQLAKEQHEFLFSTPTAQLCAVARKISEQDKNSS